MEIETLLPVFGFQVPVSEVSWQKVLISLSAKKQQYYVFAKYITNRILQINDVDNSDVVLSAIIQKFTALTNSDALVRILDKCPESTDDYYIVETDRPYIRSGEYSIPKLLDMVKSRTSMDFSCYYSLYESGSWKKCDTIFVSLPYYLEHRDGSVRYEYDSDDFEKLKTIFNYKGLGPERHVISDLNTCSFTYKVSADDNDAVRKFKYKLNPKPSHT